MCGGKGAEGDNIKAYLSGKEIDCLKKGEGCDVAIDGREYTVYCRSTGEGAVCEFIENTYYKQITREYLASKPCVAIAVFDNAEDFSDNSDESFSRQCSILKFACKSGLSSIRLFTKNRQQPLYDNFQRCRC